MPSIKEIADFIGEFAPWELAEDWDNVGVLVQCADSTEKILVSLDITTAVAEEAEALGCGLVVAHHPVIFKPLRSFDVSSPVFALASRRISAVCAHTNLDAAAGGVNDVLGAKLGLLNLHIFGNTCRIGNLPQPLTPAELAQLCGRKLGGYTQLASADNEKKIQRVAVVGGAGGDFWLDALAAGADCLITGEASHHDVLDAMAAGISVIAAGHFATEWPVTEALAERLRLRFAGIEVLVSKRNKAPFQIVL